jgi:hypothetical protein
MCLGLNGGAVAQTGVEGRAASAGTVRTSMDVVFKAYRDLQPFLGSRERFEAVQNEARIAHLLDTLGDGFHRVGEVGGSHRAEPGFTGTLTLLNDVLADSRNRFKEGNKGYVRWRLRNSVDYCVTCHTRYEVKVDFLGGDVPIESADTYARAEFLLATRQFDAAGELFLSAARHPAEGQLRIEALRRWLLIYTRVHPEPRKALTELTRFQGEVKLARSETEELQGWLESLRRWSSESQRVDVSGVRRAEHLIQQALALKEPISGKNGTVELFRATGILHRALEDGRPDAVAQRARILRLLAVAYSEIPFLFVSDLPERFIEECIREYPGTDDARKAFQLYQHLMSLAYTGSGGTRVPDDVELTLRELYDLAYKSGAERAFTVSPGAL